MKNLFLKTFGFISFIVISLLFGASVFFAFLQTKFAKAKLKDWIIEQGKEHGLTLSIGSISGNLPFTWHIQDLSLKISSSQELSLDSLKVRLMFFPLLYKKVSLNYLRVNQATFLFENEVEKNSSLFESLFKEPEKYPIFRQNIEIPSLPFNIRCKSLKIDRFSIFNKKNQASTSFDIQASGNLQKNHEDFYLNLKISYLDSLHTQGDFFLSGNRLRNRISTRLKLRLDSFQALKPFISPPFESDFFLHTTLEGEWATWTALFNNTANQSSIKKPIQGLFKAQINRFHYPQLKVLDTTWKINSLFSLGTDKVFQLENFEIKSPVINLSSQGKFNSNFLPIHFSLAFSCFDLSVFNRDFSIPLTGKLSTKLQYQPNLSTLHLLSQDLKLGSIPFEKIEMRVDSEKKEGIWEGKSIINSSHLGLPIEARSSFSFLPLKSLKLTDLLIKAPDSQLNGDLSYQIQEKILEGALFAQVLHLEQFQKSLQIPSLEGSLGAEVRFLKQHASSLQESTSMNLFLTLRNLHYKDILANEATISAKLDELFSEPKGTISFESEKIYKPILYFSSLSLLTHFENKQWPFQLHAKGSWKEPLEIKVSGNWKLTQEENNRKIDVTFSTFQGELFKTYYSLNSPFSMGISPKKLFIEPCDIKLADGQLHLEADLSNTHSKVYVKADHFPLETLSIWYPDFSFQGTSSLEAYLDAFQDKIQGRLNVLLDQTDLLQQGKVAPLKAKGSLQAYLSQNTIQLHTNLVASNNQFFDLQATLPIHYTLFPFKIHLDKQKSLSSELAMEGKLEEIFDFINMGSHQIKGLLSCHLFLSKNLFSPSLGGTIELQEGSYENFYTGTALKKVSMKLDAKGSDLTLQKLSASDKQEGSLSGQGHLLLDPKQKFPYSLDLELSDLSPLHLDMITGKVSGPLSINGDFNSLSTKGKLLVSRADVSIPDQLPLNVPVLPITYINKPSHLQISLEKPPSNFSLNLNLQLDAKERVFVHGRGLSSEWKGDLSIIEDDSSISMKGSLALLKGEFVFSGKVFSLTQGEISFNGRPNQNAFLSITGNLALPQSTVIVILRGPLTAPQLTFQSIPHMPTSSILSYILFNKDVSDITAMQAIQLAQMIVSLSGGAGPDVLETIRKSLGVDRLNIVSSSTGSDEISVQIGKYLTRGVMVTLSQSAESSQVIVEVELAKGFIFQAETQEEEEGKFTLKWNRNY